MSPTWKRPPLPEETFSASFGEGEGELLTLVYPKPLPMRLDRWLVSQRTEQSRARIQKFIDAGYVRVNGKTGKAKTPLRQGDEVQLWMPPPEPLPYLKPEADGVGRLVRGRPPDRGQQASGPHGASGSWQQGRHAGERPAASLP